MALRLEVISEHRHQLAARASIVFGVSGGSIGRAADNDWVLPDPLRYLSGHHARVLFQQGAWYLEDTSTNGTYIDDSPVAVGRRAPRLLQGGETLRLGEYRLRVHVDATDTLPPPGTGTLAQIAIDEVTPLQLLGEHADDLGASLNIEALIAEPGLLDTPLLDAVDFTPRGNDGSPGANSTSRQVARLRAAMRSRQQAVSAARSEVRAGVQAFCRGAGLDIEQIPARHDARLLHLAGRMLREALLGLKEIMRAQKALRDQLGMEDDDTDVLSPLNRAADEYLLQVIRGHESSQFDAVAQLRSSFSNASAGVRATNPALRAALAQFLSHLAPANIEAGARDGAGRGSPAATWERYREVYMTLLHATGKELPHLFTEAMAQALQREQDSQSIDTFKSGRGQP